MAVPSAHAPLAGRHLYCRALRNLTSCTTSAPSATPNTPNRCQQATTFRDESFARGQKFADELRSIIAARTISTHGTTDSFNIFWSTADAQLGDAGKVWSDKQTQGSTEMQSGLHVIANEPACFTPQDVATAQTAHAKFTR